MKTMSKKVILPIVILITAIGLMSALSSMKKPPEKKVENKKAPLVEVAPLLIKDEPILITSQGTVTPVTQSTLVAEVSGRIVQTSEQFGAGNLFTKNEILLQIDPADYQVALKRAQASLAGAEAKLAQEIARAEQAKKDWKSTGRGKASPLVLREPFVAEARANVASAEADLAKAQRDLDKTTIRAPYDGLIQLKKADLGQFVSLGTPVADIASTESAEVRLPVRQSELKQLAINHNKVILNAHSLQWNASLVRSENTINQSNRLLYLVAEFDDPYNRNKIPSKHTLRFGTFVDAQIVGSQQVKLIEVPRIAVHHGDEIYTLDENSTLVIHHLDIVHSTETSILTRTDIPMQQQVILTALQTPVAGMRLRDASKVTNETASSSNPPVKQEDSNAE